MAASQQLPKIRSICCIGAGYVGGPTCSVIASKNPDIKVTIVDLNQARIDAWKSDDIPIHEPNLLETVKIGRDGSEGRAPNLFFTTNVDQALEEADLIFIAVNTPTKTSGYGANQALDLSYVESAVERIAHVCRSDKIIVEKSTVPCGTARIVTEILTNINRHDVHFDVLSNPEFLAEGTAIKNLENPDRILIGSDTTPRGLQARAALADLYASWVPRDRIIGMNIFSAELAKLAANALLAQRVSSINALSAICEATGADIDEVAFAVGLDTRIGPRMLRASVGFGGSCLKKDVLNLAHFSDTLELPEIGSYWRSVNDINENQKSRFSVRIIRRLHNTLTDKRIAMLGVAFKKDTGDLRESAAISILASLISEEAQVAIYDPQVKPGDLWPLLEKEMGRKRETFTRVSICSSAYEACDQAHAVVIATEWDEFSNKDAHRPRFNNAEQHAAQPEESESDQSSSSSSVILTPTTASVDEGHAQGQKLDWERVADMMRYPRLVFDGRNVVDPLKLRKLGLQVECIGKSRAW
ncbi:nucleotide sugar dehydrogenase [Phlyctema vagabunda]|uniref:UDP-glucose 6-dehydrogenase n=1 Tax=Phlyctema vagabunda TaxID=108571 RepID=A0ABR4PYH6_9HELO